MVAPAKFLAAAHVVSVGVVMRWSFYVLIFFRVLVWASSLIVIEIDNQSIHIFKIAFPLYTDFLLHQQT